MGLFDLFRKSGKSAQLAEPPPPPPPPPGPPEFPFPLLEVRGREALESMNGLRDEGRQKGFWPVLIGDRDQVNQLTGSWPQSPPSIVGTLSEANRLTAGVVAMNRLDEYPALRERLGQDSGWPTTPAGMPVFRSPLDPATQRPKSRVYIAKVPSESAWRLPLILGLDGPETAPNCSEKAACLREWQDRYGVETIGASWNTLELYVGHPPRAPQDCVEIARELYVFCPETVEQGVRSIPALAASLQGSPFWFFSWTAPKKA